MFNCIFILKLEVSDEIIIDKIILALKKSKYIVENASSNSIQFKDDLWNFRWNWETLNKIDEGKLTFITDEHSTFIQLRYYVSYQIELLISLIFLVLGIFIFNDYLVIIFPIIFWLQFLYRIIVSKKIAQDLLNKLLQ